MNVKLVALDIDGTLLAPGVDHTAVPDEAMTQAVRSVIDAGVTVVLASGRMYPGTKLIADHIGITQPLVCQQGASIHHIDGSLLHRFSIDQDIAHDIATLALEEGWPYAWFDAQRYLVSEHNDASDYFARVSGVSVELHHAPRESGLIATGIDVISTPEHSSEFYQRLRTRFGDRVELLDFHSVTAAHSHEASKGLALDLLTRDMGITSSEVVAIGDSVNDVSMLRWAGLGASPAHSDPYATAAANKILEGEGVDGVAALLRQISVEAI